MKLVGALAFAAIALTCCAPTSATKSADPYGWQLRAIDAPAAWRSTEGAGIVIAVLDSGLDDSSLPGVARREVGDPHQGDTIGHGTAVVSLAAGSGDLGVWGVAPQASIFVVKVVGADGLITDESVIAGINLAVQAGASVVNLSFGGSIDDHRITVAIEGAVTAGAIVVAAAGDNGSPQSLFPANLTDLVIAAQTLKPDGSRSPYANAVGANGVGAPGMMLPAVRSDSGQVERFPADGSSMAAAIVSGSLALLQSCAKLAGRMPVTHDGALALLRASSQGAFFDLGEAMRLLGCA